MACRRSDMPRGHIPNSARRMLASPAVRPWVNLRAASRVQASAAGPFGFAIGPLAAHFLKRRVEQKYPQAAYAARQRDTGFNWGQWWVLTLLTLWGAGGLWALMQAIPMWILIMMGTRSA